MQYLEWDIRYLNCDGDAVDVDFFGTEKEALAALNRWHTGSLAAQDDPNFDVAAVVEVHDWNRHTYKTIDARGSHQALIAWGMTSDEL